MDLEKIVTDLENDEAFRQFPYRCTGGKLTIGYGRNLEDKGISVDEADVLLRNDIQSSIYDLTQIFSDFDTIPESIQRVLVNMRFQLGSYGFRAFKNMINAVENQDWDWMINEMKDSLWYTQTPNRANRLIKLIEKEM